ncbi:hypothetical protein GCM10010123_05740 [Pilimelia anulata]|uniref:Uncharacterized protein n=1 Tax=Pilimelia anulata TaxID=53371 RepID=A0A8J3B6T0_9ACTN|nr:hypothetical protein [Pilimelia anulata]GGJ78640.1 hypothetical protein GCM10010123_05740 [Pilimelia anulata]
MNPIPGGRAADFAVGHLYGFGSNTTGATGVGSASPATTSTPLEVAGSYPDR